MQTVQTVREAPRDDGACYLDGMTEDAEHEARTGDRTIRFRGRLLAEATSWTPGRRRWTDIRMYKTEAGQYVIEIVGCTEIRSEEWRYATQVSDTAEGAVECLHKYDEDGVRYLTKLADKVAHDAAEADPQFADAFLVERVA